MRIGILGSGNIGRAVGSHWVRAGHDVLFASRHPDELKAWIDGLGGRAVAVSLATAADLAEAVLLAVPLRAVPDLATELAPRLRGKLLLDACNPYEQRDGAVATEATSAGAASSWTARQFPGAHVIKVFNTIQAATLRTQAHRPGGLLAVPLAGDDVSALQLASALVHDAGFEPVVVGRLADSAVLEPGASAYGRALEAEALRRLFG